MIATKILKLIMFVIFSILMNGLIFSSFITGLIWFGFAELTGWLT